MTYQCSIEIKSFNFNSIKDKIALITNFLKAFDFISVKGPITMPLKKKKYTVLRSPHVHKKSQEHFGMFNYKTVLVITFPTEKIMQMVLNFIRKNLLLDVEIKFIKKISYQY
ncbi:MAG: 30S ribosomal protein S10 [Rickettsiales bacterium]|jgi:small subunit ribosomal protein S10|nr:30S ribosomal protein S10 [Rickettsiales bacterium]